MAQACPINFSSVDNTVSRIISLLAVIAVFLSMATGHPLPLYFLGVDLAMRLYGYKHYSPLFYAAKGIKQLLQLPTCTVDGAAKQVAGHFGLLFILLLIATAHLGLGLAFGAIAGIYVLCLLMDLFFSFCVGCKVYYLYRLIGGER